VQLVHLMDKYFQEASGNLLNESADRFVEWKKICSPTRLIKDYHFSTRQAALEFLRQLFLFEDEFNHHGRVALQNKDVRIEVYTHDIDDVTELDIDYSRVADQIYLDVSEYEK